VSVISGSTNKVIATIPVGSSPNGVAYDPSSNTIYVANYISGSITIIYLSVYSVAFSESGLLSGNWYVNVTTTGQSFYESYLSTAFSFFEPNGTYYFTVQTNYKIDKPSIYSGSFTVNGASVSRNVTFSEVKYSVTFTESGLPSGNWYVNVTGQPHSGALPYTVTSYSLSLPNGTYFYTIATGNNMYSSSPSSGSFTVNGSPISESATFTKVLYKVTFTESGLPSGTTWYVNITGGQSYTSTTNTLSFTEPNGTYSYSMKTLDENYYPSPSSGSFTVNGAAVSESVTFMEVVYSVTFTETGLTAGTSWSVTLGTTTQTSNTNTITFTEPNGSYSYSISGISGYRATAYTGTVTVNGNAVSNSIVWSVITYPITMSETGIPTGTSWTVTLSGTAFNGQHVNTTMNSTTNSITFNEPNGTYLFTVHLPSGYTSSSAKGSITVSGTSATATITAQPQTNYLLYVIVVIIAIAIIAAVIVVVRRRKK
ncbi:MAG: hypothetical protein QXP36_14840, partial [Conexivisphaerales archaeon]